MAQMSKEIFKNQFKMIKNHWNTPKHIKKRKKNKETKNSIEREKLYHFDKEKLKNWKKKKNYEKWLSLMLESNQL